MARRRRRTAARNLLPDLGLRAERRGDRIDRVGRTRRAAHERVDGREAMLGPRMDRDVRFGEQHDARHAMVTAEMMEMRTDHARPPAAPLR